jgi:hypothetical protein
MGLEVSWWLVCPDDMDRSASSSVRPEGRAARLGRSYCHFSLLRL